MADVRRMDAALSRYGNDGHEIWSASPGVAVGRHLHASLPEDPFGPPLCVGPRYVVACDVHLSEREELARELGLSLDAARMSDAAIAAAAVETWHEAAFDRIYGAFAIAAWDIEERRLLVGRDHVGLKPLFFHSSEQFFAFASMPYGLQAIPDMPLGPDMESMKRFLAGEDQSEGKTHFEGISRLMAGHYAIVTPYGLTETRYWHPDLTPLRLATHQDYVDALSRHLDSAVAASLRGVDSQVGAHLSCGFDSTAVATTAARQLASRDGTVVAYTAAPREGYGETLPNRIADESVIASTTVAMHPNMTHVIVRPDRTPMANLRRTASIYGVPVPNICNEGWLDAINDDAAERGIAVMLEANFGNGTISENGLLALPGLLHEGRLFAWLKLVVRLLRSGEIGLPRILWKSFSHLLPNWLWEWLTRHQYGVIVAPLRNSSLKEQYLQEVVTDVARESGAQERLVRSGWIRPVPSSLSDRLILLTGDYGAPSCKGMLAEWNIDYRDPTADRRLVEFSLRVPAEELIHDGRPRTLLRQVLADRAPPEVLANRLRGYQAADWHEWLNLGREEIVQEIDRIEMFEPSAELIDVDRLRELVNEWPEPDSEEWIGYSALVDYRICMLRAISAASFMREAARSNY